MSPRAVAARGAAAGIIAALAWAAVQPLDKRIFRSGYDDVELLGKLATRGPGWAPAGLVVHAANGAAFGAVYALLRHRLHDTLPGPPWAQGLIAGQAENFALWPLVTLVDRLHPARDELTPLTGNRRALAQATWRHALFGFVLGGLEARLRARRPVA